MLRKPYMRVMTGTALLTVLLLSLVTPVLAFDGRESDTTVTIRASEIVNDDLYVTAQTVVIDGTIKGDLVAFAQTVTVNGVVEGDLIAAGQDIVINGTVQDDARIAGAVLFLGEKAKLGGDLVGAGASLEARKGSSIGQDVVFAGGQALLAGEITRNVTVAVGSLALQGAIGGNVKADVGSSSEGYSHPMMFGPDADIVPIPTVKAGLSIAPGAKIGGKLDYTSPKQLSIPEGAVAGKITYSEPKPDEEKVTPAPKPVTLIEQLILIGLDIARKIVTTFLTVILFGLLLLWLFPSFLKTGVERIKAAPLPSAGWGLISIAAFFFALLVLFIAMLVGGIAFGILTLPEISGAIIFVSLLTMFALTIVFMLSIGFVAQIIVSLLGGQLILGAIRPELAEHKYLPLFIGALIYALLVAIPIFGGLVWVVVVLLGLGALWRFGQDVLTKRLAHA